MDIEANRAFKPETIAALQASTPRLCYVDGPPGRSAPQWAIVLKLPKPGDAMLYRAQLNDPIQRASAQSHLLRNMFAAGWTEWDDECTLDQLTAQFPFVEMGCSKAIKDFTGIDEEERAKK